MRPCPALAALLACAALLALQAEVRGRAWRGTVLDPEDGRLYRCVATLLPGGKRLQLRGFVGIELLGRSETWTRAD